MDYEERLMDYIDSLDTGFSVFADSNDVDTSLSVVRMPGSRTVTEYYDGVAEKIFKFFVQLKCEHHEREKAVDALDLIASSLDNVLDIPSNNGSYDYGQTTVNNEPYFMGQDDQSLYFRFQIDTELTVYREE